VVRFAQAPLKRLWVPGLVYVKAGVILVGYEVGEQRQFSLFPYRERVGGPAHAEARRAQCAVWENSLQMATALGTAAR
jgi:hypothetical protein